MFCRRSVKSFAILIGAILLSTSVLFTSRPIRAASGVTIVSQSIGCSAVTVTYMIANPSPTDSPAELNAFDGNTNASIGLVLGPGTTPGPHTVTISLSPSQPVGTPIYVLVEVTGAHVYGSTQPCNGSSGPSAPPWPNDNRLNPVPDDYYVIYCSGNLIHVWVGIPSGHEIATFSLVQIASMNSGFAVSNGVRAVKSGDAVTFSGSNGNSAPQPGSKTISLNGCIAANGGLPPTSTPSPTAMRRVAPTMTPLPTVKPIPTTAPSSSGNNFFVSLWNFYIGQANKAFSEGRTLDGLIWLISGVLDIVGRILIGVCGTVIVPPGTAIGWQVYSRFRRKSQA
jgi:hypothetical protein